MEKPRLRGVILAPLTLRSYWLEELHVLGGAPGPSSELEESAESPTLEVKASRPSILKNPDNPRQHFVRLRVRATRGQQTLDVTISGLFEIEGDALNSESQTTWVQFNAPSILYGLVRGIAATVSGASDSGRFDLPSINVVKLVEG